MCSFSHFYSFWIYPFFKESGDLTLGRLTLTLRWINDLHAKKDDLFVIDETCFVDGDRALNQITKRIFNVK